MTAGRTIYLNDAATSWPKAPGVVAAVAAAMEKLPTQPDRSFGEARPLRDQIPLGPVVSECRGRLALLLDVQTAARIVLPTSVTSALNIAIWGLGLGLSPTDRVITSEAEHNSVLRPLRHVRKLRGFEMVHVGFDSSLDLSVEHFMREIRKGARLVVLAHASNVTGRVYDVEALFGLAREAGAVTVLDASQTVGHLDVHPGQLNADLVAFPGHKGLRGPVGVGALYVSPGVDLEQVFVGGTGGMSDVFYQPADYPVRLEAGTPNIPAIAGLNAALRWHEEQGAGFRERERELAGSLRAGLRSIRGVRMYDDHPRGRYTPLVAFSLENLDVETTGRLLYEDFGIVCRAGLHCAPLIHQAFGAPREGTVRLSLSGFNTGDEVERALAAVKTLSARRA